jgi:hypothetical protein
MPVVRYVALAALVVWLAGALQAVRGDLLVRVDQIGLACGAIVIAALFIMKFVGPPPHAFAVRVALAAAMIAVTFLGLWNGGRTATTLWVTVALGFVLLFWYARE